MRAALYRSIRVDEMTGQTKLGRDLERQNIRMKDTLSSRDNIENKQISTPSLSPLLTS